ncbi:MAG: hypothetical protein ACI9KF_001453 [Arenicella sp.]|jgi:hypothetical protein
MLKQNIAIFFYRLDKLYGIQSKKVCEIILQKPPVKSRRLA